MARMGSVTRLSAFALAICVAALAGCRSASQAPDDDWIPEVARPEFPHGEGPVVLVDAAHGNWHTIDGRYRVFAQLLENDGYRVRSAEEAVSAQLLAEADVFIIANAVQGAWVLPTRPAFTPDEVERIVDWVESGGSLLLIADHMPFPGAVEDLAAAFGVVFLNGYAMKSFAEGGTLTLTRESGLLADHAIVRGRSEPEAVPSVKSFTGQAFRSVAPGLEPLMLLPDDWQVYFPAEAGKKIEARTPKISARGLLQGGVLRHGTGRVAVFGEAAMFTAQMRPRNGGLEPFGLNDPEASHNAQFVLNVLHWLSGRLDG